MKIKVTCCLFLFLFILSSHNIFSQAPVITTQPHNQGVIVGQTATFTVESSGDTLSYQWYKNNVAIFGAINSTYTTPATILADNGSLFSVKITNSHGSDSSDAATLFVTATGSRVTNSIQVLYNFKEGSGTVVHDNSGVGTPYDMDLDNPSATVWTPEGLGVNDVAYINSNDPATKVINASKFTNEVTIETWLIPAYANEDGGRILTVSPDAYNSNFSLLQNNGNFQARIRTTETSMRGDPGLISDSGTANPELTHLVITRASNGTIIMYKNGAIITSDTINGDFSNWDSSYRMQIANEFETIRDWLGTFYLVAVYNRALSPNEVQENYNVGVNIDHEPKIIIQPKDIGLFTGQAATFNLSAIGDAPITYQWRKNGIDIPGANSTSYTVPSVSTGDDGDIYSVIISNGSGSDVSRNANLYVTDENERVTSGQILLYNFHEGTGDTVKDKSGYGTPLNLTIGNQNAVTWKPEGLEVESTTNIISSNSASKLNNAAITKGEFTFEAWIKPYDLVQSPATIFTIASNSTNINFTIYQASDVLQTVLRTSETSAAGQILATPGNSLSDKLLHIVYVRNTNGNSEIYIDSVLVSTNPIAGNLSNWNTGYLLKIGSQFPILAPWKGLYNLIAFYNRALGSNEVAHNFAMGPLKPTINAPTELNAIKDDPDTNNVKLTWIDNSSNELGFVIQRKLGDSASVAAFTDIDTVGTDITMYVDSTTSDTTQYTYRIYAYNADTVSAFSNLATITTPLPVELLSFLANVVNGKAILTWETATEINNAGFSIERSIDNKKFSEVSFIKGKGTSTEKTFYSYTDKSLLSGKYYYRLKQIDFDGTYQYSKSIEIDMGLPSNYSLEQNFPNPFNPSTTIRFALPMNAKVNLKLYNTLGQVVANILSNNMDAGVHEMVFNASNLSSGVYFYRMEAHGTDGSNFVSTKRMIIMK